MAARAGVSSATVSYVVNGGPRGVAPPTRARVLAAIEELGYHPDAIARSLRTRHSRVLGLVVPDVANPFFAELARCVEEAAHSRGYRLLLGSSHEEIERERDQLIALRDHRVEGILLVPADARGGQVAADIDGIAVVALDRMPQDWTGDAVSADGEAGGRLAIDHLLQRGYRRIGIIHGPLRLGHARERRDRCIQALANVGEPIAADMIAEGAFDYAGGYAAARRIIDRADRPSALCCGNDVMAVGALAAAHDVGLVVPTDLAVIGYDDLPLAAYTVPSLTTIAQPYTEMAATAMDFLLDHLDPHTPPAFERRRRLPVTLVVRQTTGEHEPWRTGR